MSGVDLLPKWSPARQDPAVKGNVAGCKNARFSVFKVYVKDYVSLHTRISNLIFFCLLLGTGAILGAVTTLNVVGYLSSPGSGFLLTGFPARDQFLTARGDDFLSLNTTTIAPEVQQPEVQQPVATFSDGSYEQRAAAPPLSPPLLMPHPVDLANLSDVYHSMSDAELLWRASAGASHPARLGSVTPKVAYMFLTRGFLPLRPLWERYFKGHGDLCSIYVHAHPNYMPDVPSDSAFYRRNIPSKEVFWGMLSVFAAERRLLANALLDPANKRFVLLSESCIPITALPVAYKYFMETDDSFVHSFYEPGKGGLGRYNRIKGVKKMKPEVSPKQWRKGSQWFEMTRELAVLVVSDNIYYPKFETALCGGDDHICYIDEHYLPTVLTILAPSKLANRTSHYLDFSRNTAHPKQWERKEIDPPTLGKMTTGHSCIYNGNLTETCYMFARKISPDALEPLLQLAATSFGIP